MGSSHSNRHHRLSWAVGASLALAAGMSNSVLAETPAELSKSAALKQAKVDAANPLGAMTFEHVRVVNVPVASSASQSKSEGMRAYVDAQTKRLRGQTPEEALQAASEKRVLTKSARSSVARGASANSDAGSTGPQMIYGADGSVGLMLDEESMVYQVAYKDASGAVGQQCVNGKTAATKALQNKQAEVQHDR
jgi:hypothetical protein